MNNAPIERLKKILALARRGVDGEKVAAEAMLAKLLKKYGMTAADLEDDAPRAQRRFEYTGQFERRLLVQCIARATNRSDFPIYRPKRSKTVLIADLTAAEFAEVDLSFTTWAPALAKHLDLALSAFIQTNEIFADTPDDAPERDPMDLADLEALLSMMRGTKKTSVVRMIGGPA